MSLASASSGRSDIAGQSSAPLRRLVLTGAFLAVAFSAVRLWQRLAEGPEDEAGGEVPDALRSDVGLPPREELRGWWDFR